MNDAKCCHAPCTFPDCACSWVGQPAQADPLSDLDRAILQLAHYDLQYHRLRTAARLMLATRRQFSSHQTALLTETVDALERAVVEEPPGIDWRKGVEK